MAELNDKMVEAVAKLIKLTQENKIKWVSAKPPVNLKGDSEDFVETIFLTKHDNKYLRLYEREHKVEVNARLQPFANQGSYWKSVVNLEIVDANHNNIWTFPSVTPLEDLLASVRYQVADVNDFIESLLKD